MARAAVQKVGRQDPVGRAFGDRVRALREQADLTLDQLSKLSGVSRAMLSQVERGEKSPTIGVAKRISHALGASFSALVGDEGSTRRTFAIVRKDQRQVFRDAETGSRTLSPFAPDAGHACGSGASSPSPKDIDRQIARLPCGVHQACAGFSRTCRGGIDNVETILEEGDSLYFEADAEHWFANPTPKPSEYYLIIAAAQAFVRRNDAGS
ncbi:helix-turn-helix domain-containing protein [Mesorhizobium sp. ORM6]